MRKPSIYLLFFSLFATSCFAQTAPPQKTTPLPTVDKNLVIRGANIGRIFEGFRPQISSYLKEIEAANDFANWKVPPSKSYEQ